MLIFIPEQLFAEKAHPIGRYYAYPATKLPYPALVIVISCIALDVRFDMELLIKLLEEKSFVENPS